MASEFTSGTLKASYLINTGDQDRMEESEVISIRDNKQDGAERIQVLIESGFDRENHYVRRYQFSEFPQTPADNMKLVVVTKISSDESEQDPKYVVSMSDGAGFVGLSQEQSEEILGAFSHDYPILTRFPESSDSAMRLSKFDIGSLDVEDASDYGFKANGQATSPDDPDAVKDTEKPQEIPEQQDSKPEEKPEEIPNDAEKPEESRTEDTPETREEVMENIPQTIEKSVERKEYANDVTTETKVGIDNGVSYVSREIEWKNRNGQERTTTERVEKVDSEGLERTRLTIQGSGRNRYQFETCRSEKGEIRSEVITTSDRGENGWTKTRLMMEDRDGEVTYKKVEGPERGRSETTILTKDEYAEEKEAALSRLHGFNSFTEITNKDGEVELRRSDFTDQYAESVIEKAEEAFRPEDKAVENDISLPENDKEKVSITLGMTCKDYADAKDSLRGVAGSAMVRDYHEITGIKSALEKAGKSKLSFVVMNGQLVTADTLRQKCDQFVKNYYSEGELRVYSFERFGHPGEVSKMTDQVDYYRTTGVDIQKDYAEAVKLEEQLIEKRGGELDDRFMQAFDKALDQIGELSNEKIERCLDALTSVANDYLTSDTVQEKEDLIQTVEKIAEDPEKAVSDIEKEESSEKQTEQDEEKKDSDTKDEDSFPTLSFQDMTEEEKENLVGAKADADLSVLKSDCEKVLSDPDSSESQKEKAAALVERVDAIREQADKEESPLERAKILSHGVSEIFGDAKPDAREMERIKDSFREEKVETGAVRGRDSEIDKATGLPNYIVRSATFKGRIQTSQALLGLTARSNTGAVYQRFSFDCYVAGLSREQKEALVECGIIRAEAIPNFATCIADLYMLTRTNIFESAVYSVLFALAAGIEDLRGWKSDVSKEEMLDNIRNDMDKEKLERMIDLVSDIQVSGEVPDKDTLIREGLLDEVIAKPDEEIGKPDDEIAKPDTEQDSDPTDKSEADEEKPEEPKDEETQEEKKEQDTEKDEETESDQENQTEMPDATDERNDDAKPDTEQEESDTESQTEQDTEIPETPEEVTMQDIETEEPKDADTAEPQTDIEQAEQDTEEDPAEQTEQTEQEEIPVPEDPVDIEETPEEAHSETDVEAEPENETLDNAEDAVSDLDQAEEPEEVDSTDMEAEEPSDFEAEPEREDEISVPEESDQTETEQEESDSVEQEDDIETDRQDTEDGKTEEEDAAEQSETDSEDSGEAQDTEKDRDETFEEQNFDSQEDSDEEKSDSQYFSDSDRHESDPERYESDDAVAVSSEDEEERDLEELDLSVLDAESEDEPENDNLAQSIYDALYGDSPIPYERIMEAEPEEVSRAVAEACLAYNADNPDSPEEVNAIVEKWGIEDIYEVGLTRELEEFFGKDDDEKQAEREERLDAIINLDGTEEAASEMLERLESREEFDSLRLIDLNDDDQVASYVAQNLDRDGDIRVNDIEKEPDDAEKGTENKRDSESLAAVLMEAQTLDSAKDVLPAEQMMQDTEQKQDNDQEQPENDPGDTDLGEFKEESYEIPEDDDSDYGFDY